MTLTKEDAQKAYDDLVAYRRCNILTKSKDHPGMVEVHHVIPLSINGSDVKDNKVALLAKEHFMAHVYLWIIHHDDEFHDQMLCALMNMHKGTKNGSRKELRDFMLMSEDYQQAREEFGRIASQIAHEANAGSKNPHYGKHWYKDLCSSACSMHEAGKQPAGWVRGRHANVDEKRVRHTAQKGRQQLGHCEPKNKGKHLCINVSTGKRIFLGDNEDVPVGFAMSSELRLMSSKQKHDEVCERKQAKHDVWLKQTQAMADYFSQHGYEATCKKFNVNMSNESMLMRFIRARKLYGITFISQPGKRRCK